MSDDKHPWVTLSSEPFTDQLKQLLLQRCTEPLPMSFPSGSCDANAIAKVVNLGIDSHLEAVLCAHNWDIKEVGPYKLARLEVTVEPASVPVLVRRLMEPWNHGITDEDERDEWTGLARDICYIHQIELM